MKLLKLSSSFVLLIPLLLNLGCSSSGDDSTDPTTDFALFPASTFTAGYTETRYLSGPDSTGERYTGTLSTQTQPTSTYFGQPAIPIVIEAQFTNTATGLNIADISTGYYSTSANDRHYLGFDSPIETTVSAVTSAIPQTAQIGDFGAIGTYTFNSGNVAELSWRLDDDGNDLAKRFIHTTFKDQLNNIIFSKTSTSTIDISGNFITTQLVYYFSDTDWAITLDAQ